MPSQPASRPRVDLLPVDISPFAKGNTGIPYVTTIESGRTGPHVVVMALTHGNELCGAHALKFLFDHDVRPIRGRLTLAFNNTAAYHAFDPANLTESRFIDEDLNRVGSPDVLEGEANTAEKARARALRPVVEAADFLLDIHSMQQPCPPLMLCGLQPRGRALALAIGFPRFVVADGGHKAGRRLRDFGAFDDSASPNTALLVECGQHWDRASVEVAQQTMLRFLAHLDIIDGDFAAAHLRPDGEPPALIEVTGPHTIASPDFRFVTPFHGLEVIEKAGTVIAYDGAEAVTTPYNDCVLIMPSLRLRQGQTAVRFGRFAD